MTAETSATRDGTVTMQDIATELGVSVAAVSYALNGRDNMIGAKTRERILATAKRRNYVPNRLMKAVRTRRTEVVGVLVPGFRTTFFPDLIDAIERALAERGYHALICQTHSDNRVTRENLEMLRQRRVDGLIAAPRFDQEPLYRPLVAAGLKIVFIDAQLPGLPIPSVQSDDRLGSCLATRHLLACGHRRIATLRYPEKILFGGMRARFEGYCGALKEADIPVDEALVGIDDSGLSIEQGYRHGREILSRTDATAFFCPLDMAAFGVMKAARDLGRAVPGDLALVGYANQAAGTCTTPTLSTVDQKPGEIGRAAVERLLAMIDGAAVPEPRHCLIKPELLIRESSGKPEHHEDKDIAP